MTPCTLTRRSCTVRVSAAFRGARSSASARRRRLAWRREQLPAPQRPPGPARRRAQAHDAPVDVAGRRRAVTAVGPALDRPPGVRRVDAEGRWLIPGLWDQHVHLAQWTLTSQRLDLGRRPLARGRDRAGRRADRRATPTCRSSAGATALRAGTATSRSPSSTRSPARPPVVLISGDGHHAWLNTTALMHLALPVRDSVVCETRVVRGVPAPGHAGRQRRHLARGLPPDARRRPPARASSGMVDFEFGGGPRSGPSGWREGCDLLRVRMATYADAPRRRDRRRPAHRRPAPRLRRPRHDGPAQDHQRRVAQHPDRLVLRAVRRRAPAEHPPGQPNLSGASCASCSPAPHARRPRDRHPRDRRRGRAARRWTRTPPPAPAARSSTPS